MPSGHKQPAPQNKAPRQASDAPVSKPAERRKHPWLLTLAVILMILWIGFLFGMVWHG
ncbi:MAG TPA: hypothetical protein VHV08_16835 [Pirellulales bacterium]|nr:hypothetical protein [Pirellulales bacterium]